MVLVFCGLGAGFPVSRWRCRCCGSQPTLVSGSLKEHRCVDLVVRNSAGMACCLRHMTFSSVWPMTQHTDQKVASRESRGYHLQQRSNNCSIDAMFAMSQRLTWLSIPRHQEVSRLLYYATIINFHVLFTHDQVPLKHESWYGFRSLRICAICIKRISRYTVPRHGSCYGRLMSHIQGYRGSHRMKYIVPGCENLMTFHTWVNDWSWWYFHCRVFVKTFDHGLIKITLFDTLAIWRAMPREEMLPHMYDGWEPYSGGRSILNWRSCMLPRVCIAPSRNRGSAKHVPLSCT